MILGSKLHTELKKEPGSIPHMVLALHWGEIGIIQHSPKETLRSCPIRPFFNENMCYMLLHS